MNQRPPHPGQIEPSRAQHSLGAALQSVPQPIFGVSLAGAVVLWNRAAERAFGWSAAEVLGRPLPLGALVDGVGLDELRERVGREGDLAGLEVRRLRRDGRPIDLSLTVALLPDAGAAGGLLVAATEITALKAEAEALRVSEARYRLLAEHVQDIIYRLSLFPELAFEYVSPAVTAVTGHTPDEFYTNPQLRIGLIHPDDRATADELLRVTDGQPIELRWLHKDGRVIWTEQRNTLIRDEAGRPVAVEGIVRDVSARRRADAERDLLRAALAAAANAVVITDTEGIIQWANPAFTILTGYEVDEVLGRKTSLLHSGHHDRGFYSQLWSTVLDGRSWRGELVNRRKDGRLYVEEMTITPVLVDGKVAHFVAIKQEVTARAERAREREALLSIAQTMREARSRAELLPILLEQTRLLLEADAAALALTDPATGDTVFELGQGEWEELGRTRLPGSVGVTGRVIATGELYHTDDVLGDPSFALPELHHGVRAAICAPLRTEGSVIGALWAGRLAPLSPAEARLVAAIADLAANAIHRATLSEQTERRLRRLVGLRAIDHAITGSLDIRLSLSVVLDQTVQQLGVDAAAVLILNPQSLTLEHAAGRGFRTNAILGTRVRLGEGLAGTAALERKTIVATGAGNLEQGFPRQALLAVERFESYIAVPLVAKGQVRGILEVFHRTPLAIDDEWLAFLETLAGQAAVAVDNAELFQYMQRANIDMALAYDTTLEGWSRALELRDKETEGHSQRVTELTVRLARAMGLPEEEIVHIRRGALLHDIGKMGLPDAILLKPGPLTPDEREVVKLHPGYAYELLRPIAFLRPALDIPYCHHERWDGTGYPRGLARDQIPLAARIFAVVDVFDAVTSNRPYQRAWPQERARALLRDEAGKHFDPQVVATFLRILDDNVDVG